MDKVQFLSTPVLHVNGPCLFAYKTLNSRFISDFNAAFWKEWPSYSLPAEFTIFRCDGDGYMRAVLRLDENGWTCLQHDDCKLRQAN